MFSLIKGLTWYEWLTLTCVIPSSMSMFFVVQEWMLKRKRSLSNAVPMLPISLAAGQTDIFSEADMSAAAIVLDTTGYDGVQSDSTEQKQPSQLAA